MGKIQWNQKLTPDVHSSVDKEADKLIKSGRIKDKGDIIGLCFNDYLVLENRRNLNKNGNTYIQEGLEYLEKLFKVIENIHANYENQINMLKRQIEDNLSAYEKRIGDLEQDKIRLNAQLLDLAYELGNEKKGNEELQDLLKGKDRLVKQMKDTDSKRNNKKSAAN